MNNGERVKNPIGTTTSETAELNTAMHEASHSIKTDPESVEQTLEHFDRWVDWNSSLTSKDEFRKLLESGKQLRMKFGADITADTLHLGHGVNLQALRTLQDLGHKVVFLLGGFTTLVGDPTGNMEARNTSKAMKDVESNKEKFIEQIKQIIRFDDPNLIEIRDNQEWYGSREKAGTFTFFEFFSLIMQAGLTVNGAEGLLARDMFQERLREGKIIGLAEFLYPFLQGYDSKELESDLTIVGSDQMFNEDMGRKMQRIFNQKPQAVLCTKITQGLDGKGKQSKSRPGSYVGIGHDPSRKFSDVMKMVEDPELITEWMKMYTHLSDQEIDSYKEQYESRPLEFKKKLAWYIVERFHGAEKADQVQDHFEKTLLSKEMPSQVTELTSNPHENIISLIAKARKSSSSDARRLIEQGGVVLYNKDTGEKMKFTDLLYVPKNDDIFIMSKTRWFKVKKENA